MTAPRLLHSMSILLLVLAAATAIAVAIGRQPIEFSKVLNDPFARTLFFQLRLPRVLLGLVTGASLGLAGAALQALFRNPLADEFQQAKKQLEGLERYLIQLWREYLSPRRPVVYRPGVARPGMPSRTGSRQATRVIRVPAPRPPV